MAAFYKTEYVTDMNMIKKSDCVELIPFSTSECIEGSLSYDFNTLPEGRMGMGLDVDMVPNLVFRK